MVTINHPTRVVAGRRPGKNVLKATTLMINFVVHQVASYFTVPLKRVGCYISMAHDDLSKVVDAMVLLPLLASPDFLS